MLPSAMTASRDSHYYFECDIIEAADDVGVDYVMVAEFFIFDNPIQSLVRGIFLV